MVRKASASPAPSTSTPARSAPFRSTPWETAAAVSHGVDLNGADLAGVEVDGAGEAEAFLTIRTAEEIDHADDPVIAAGIVGDAGIEELDAATAEALCRLPTDRILADADGVFGSKSLHDAA